MTTSKERSYNCKDEELTVICRNAFGSFSRDKKDFFNFSSIFNEDYANNFYIQIGLAEELVSPIMETEELKKITQNLYQTMGNVGTSAAKTRTYLQLAKDTIGVSPKDFGLSPLSQKINNRDAEGVLKNLVLVNSHIQKYGEQLKAVGFPDSLADELKNAAASIQKDNQRQYEIFTKRKAIVQSNRKSLNELYGQLIEILNVGKTLYKTDPVKVKEYTYNSLLKSVRIVKKQS
jgi:hypothetical protein